MESVECPVDKTDDEIEEAIHALISKHPILKGRIDDKHSTVLLICDSYPLIESTDSTDCSTLMKPFDLNKYLARFFIVDNKYSKSIVYDVHHIINDAVGFSIINNDLTTAIEGDLNRSTDLGFLHANHDSFESKFEAEYESAHRFYRKMFKDIEDAGSIALDENGTGGIVSLPIRGIKNDVDEFCRNNNITVGIFLNGIFARAYSHFIKSSKVCYNFVEHGRHDDYAHDSLGMFARTTPVLVDCGYDNIKDYLDYFSDLTLNSMFNNVYPYRLLEKEFGLNNTVLFEYNFDLNDVSDIEDDITVKENCKDEFADFFTIVNDLDDGYVIHVRHTEMFSDDTAIHFVRLYAEILTRTVKGKY